MSTVSPLLGAGYGWDGGAGPLVYTPPLAAQMGTLVQSLQEARTESTSHQHTVNSDSGAHGHAPGVGRRVQQALQGREALPGII